MSTSKELFPQINRPLEYVAFLNFHIPTLEGPAYVFMACDGYSEFAFNIGVEPDENPESIIKAVYRLTENEEFVKHRGNGFTLVFDRWEELSEQIEAIVMPVKGKILFSKNFNRKIAKPLITEISQILGKGML